MSQRTREIGVRVALEADGLRIFGQILGESLAVAPAGVVIGLFASVALTRYVESLLFDVKPTDHLVYIAVPILMLTVAAAASYLPSRHAETVDPVYCTARRIARLLSQYRLRRAVISNRPH